MKRLLAAIDGFFFARISPLGFGLMRSMWAASNLFFMACQWQDVTLYYSGEGYFPAHLVTTVTRWDYRFSLLNYITQPNAVWVLYLLLLFALTCMMLGIVSRWSTWLSVLLMFSFQEHTFTMFAGGDTMMRTLGFYLAIAPHLSAFSLDRMWQQWKYWSEERVLLPHATMPIWPYRLVLWQFIVIYVTAGWYKSLDTMWTMGSGVAVSLHDIEFIRFPLIVSDLLTPLSGLANYLTLLMQLAWVLLLVPQSMWRFTQNTFQKFSLKRFLIFLGFIFHLLIAILLDAGIFSFAMFTGYCGLLLAEDFHALRERFNRHFRGHVAVLYDGDCSGCLRLVFSLLSLDHLHRLHVVDYRDDAHRREIAPDLPLKKLQHTLMIRLPSGKLKEGFAAIEALCHHLPTLWILVPFFFLPGFRGLLHFLLRSFIDQSGCRHMLARGL